MRGDRASSFAVSRRDTTFQVAVYGFEVNKSTFHVFNIFNVAVGDDVTSIFRLQNTEYEVKIQSTLHE